jgi:hypothetical protein
MTARTAPHSRYGLLLVNCYWKPILLLPCYGDRLFLCRYQNVMCPEGDRVHGAARLAVPAVVTTLVMLAVT